MYVWNFLTKQFELPWTYFLSAFCSDPGVPENGARIGGDFTDGQMVAYRCNENFNLVGSSTSFCVAGQWNATKPTCKGMYLYL